MRLLRLVRPRRLAALPAGPRAQSRDVHEAAAGRAHRGDPRAGRRGGAGAAYPDQPARACRRRAAAHIRAERRRLPAHRPGAVAVHRTPYCMAHPTAWHRAWHRAWRRAVMLLTSAPHRSTERLLPNYSLTTCDPLLTHYLLPTISHVLLTNSTIDSLRPTTHSLLTTHYLLRTTDKQLDGETEWKLRSAVAATQRLRAQHGQTRRPRSGSSALASCGARRPRACARQPPCAPEQSHGRVGLEAPPWLPSKAPP